MRVWFWALAAGLAVSAAEPPADLARRLALRESASEAERANYAYTQTVTMEEFGERGKVGGAYREVREIIFSPDGERSEKLVGSPQNNLRRLIMTPEDFSDLRDIQPLLLTTERLRLYDIQSKGEETLENTVCWVLQVRPRQILYGQRLFEGTFWVDQRDYSIIRSQGRAVPQMLSSRTGKENLFPWFTTVREKVGEFWFPIYTHADDTLHFTSGPIRIRLAVRYRDYKRFSAESRIVP
ncbi:MAG TPA: hypothetical protein VES20_12495 [Bryobacteraceae bacterium]|nr:hypothetical protein [Bryobacteraceae bacterium]